MSIEAAAQALASDAPVPEPVKVEVVEEPQVTEDDALAQVWDNAQPKEEDAPAEEIVDEPVAEEQPEPEPETEPEIKAEPVEAPSILPKSVKDVWGDIPDSAKDALAGSHKEMMDKLAAQGRQLQGISPIRDALVEIVNEAPELAGYRPEQVIQEIQNFRKTVLQPLEKDPVNTILQVAKERGIEGHLKAALEGQAPPAGDNNTRALMQEIAGLKRQLAQVVDPEYQRQMFDASATQRDASNMVQDFASKAEHWAEVEDTMPGAIAYVQSTEPNLSGTEVLERAYSLEIQRIGKATPKPAVETPEQVDPEKTEKALKAKAVNVSSRASGKAKPLTEDQLLNQIWTKNQQ